MVKALGPPMAREKADPVLVLPPPKPAPPAKEKADLLSEASKGLFVDDDDDAVSPPANEKAGLEGALNEPNADCSGCPGLLFAAVAAAEKGSDAGGVAGAGDVLFRSWGIAKKSDESGD